MVLRGIQHHRRGPARCTPLTRRDLFPLRCRPSTITRLLSSADGIDPVFPTSRHPVRPAIRAALLPHALSDGKRRFLCHIASTA